jgi:hypothetical protein
MRLVAIGFAYSEPETGAEVTDSFEILREQGGYRSTPAAGFGEKRSKVRTERLGGAT